jgi:ubiquinone/menaquinone biosynthesis C-methylase UbiE
VTTPSKGFDHWLRQTPLGCVYVWLQSLPGTLLYNTPAYRLHEELQLNPGNRVLDIGCGRGALLQLLGSRVAFAEPPVGLDTSRALLDLAVGGSALVQASPVSLPFADESFDIVTCSYVTQRLDGTELLRLFQEVRRVLDPGGIALVWDFSRTRSSTLNALHDRVLEAARAGTAMRSYTTLSAYALEAGFEWVSNAHLRPFLFPPIPRVSIIIGKAPIGWQPPDMAQGLVPDTQARSLVAGVSREGKSRPAAAREPRLK